VVDRLLWGAPAARHEVGYPLEMWHVGLVVSGARARDAARALAEILGTALLAVPREKGAVWAWLGSRRRISSQSVQDAVAERGGLEAKFAVGEPGRNVEGWRSTHFEARATLAVAVRRSADVTCFAEVAPEAIALQSPDLARSLQATYLAPLSGKHERGSVLRQTLRAYFAAGRNASSAAAILRVNRRTVENRLRSIEQQLGRPLNGCGAELELALRLEDLDRERSTP
jgi:DNA-binding PucR family transcriptional regulator